MHFKMMFVFVLILVVNVQLAEILMTKDIYGPYDVEFKDYTQCQGTKAVNLTQFTTKMEIEGNDAYSVTDLSLLSTFVIDEIRIVVYTIKDKNKVLLFTKKVNKPCEHFALSSVISSTVNATANCVWKKGNYTVRINMSDMTNKIQGSSFFYGEYSVKTIVLSKKGNVFCLFVGMVFKKKL